MKVAYGFLVSVILIMPCIAIAVSESDIPIKKRTVYGLYLTPAEAYQMKSSEYESVLFIDVRTRAEMKFIGATDLMDANIPIRFMHPGYPWAEKSSTYRTQVNDHFANDVENLVAQKGLNKSSPLILICQSGSRVPRAAKQLHAAGFTTVYSVYEGFEGSKAKTGENKGKRVVNGWKNADLPWSYKLHKPAMYFNFDTSKASSQKLMY